MRRASSSSQQNKYWQPFSNRSTSLCIHAKKLKQKQKLRKSHFSSLIHLTHLRLSASPSSMHVPLQTLPSPPSCQRARLFCVPTQLKICPNSCRDEELQPSWILGIPRQQLPQHLLKLIAAISQKQRSQCQTQMVHNRCVRPRQYRIPVSDPDSK